MSTVIVLTCNFGVEKIWIRLPQIVEKFWRERYVIITVFKKIIAKRQSRIFPFLMDKHINTKIHIFHIYRVDIHDKHAKLNDNRSTFGRWRSNFFEICLRQENSPYRWVVKSYHEMCSLAACVKKKDNQKIIWQRQGQVEKSMSFMYHPTEWAMCNVMHSWCRWAERKVLNWMC